MTIPMLGRDPTSEERAQIARFLAAPKAINDSGDTLRDRVARAWHVSGELADDPEIAALRRDALHAGDAGRGRRWAGIAIGGLAAAAAALAILVVPQRAGLHWPFAGGASAERELIASAPGQRMAMRLADGTLVTLDARTRMRVAIDDRDRRVELIEGRALFDVKHDPRPFVVASAGGETIDLGTKFSVDSDGRSARVVLIEGKVLVRPRGGAPATAIAPGEVVRYGGGAMRGAAIPAGADPAGWTEGRLVFEETPLTEALATLSRYSRAPIVATPQVAAQHRVVTGVFTASRHQAAVESLAAALGLRVEAHPDGSRVLAD